MLEPLFEFLERLISQFTWKRLAFVLVLLLAVLTAVVAFESYTSRFRLGKIEKLVNVIELAERSPSAFQLSTRRHLAVAMNNAASELELLSSGQTTAFSLPSSLLKGLAAFAPWTMLLVIIPLLPGGGTKEALAGVFIVAIPCAVLGAFLPDFSSSWINYIAYPLGSFSLVFVLVIAVQRAKRRVAP